MRTLIAAQTSMLLFALGCGDDTPPPIDAPMEHIIPSDLGATCESGAPAGCFAISDSPRNGCQDRCISIGNFPAICSTYCLTDADCGPGASHCTDLGTNHRACMAMTGNPNEGCTLTDAPGPVDAAVHD